MGKSDFLYVPLTRLTSPFGGAYCIADNWWVVDRNDNARIFIKNGAYAPQCNAQKEVISFRLKDGERAVIVPLAFIDAKRYFDL